MPWGSMSNDNRVRVLLELVGGPTYREQLLKASAATNTLAEANIMAQKAALKAARSTFLYNQMLFTLRRYTFYATLGITALIGEVFRLGFSYNATMQQAKAMLGPIFASEDALQNTLRGLYTLAAKTPFQFKDTVRAFQLMYGAFRPLGISAQETTQTIGALTNALAFSGKNTPAALQRVSIALQHMAYMGRLTGKTVQTLASDGLPIYDILNKKLGVTGEMLHNVAQLGIPTGVVLKAIRSYLLTEPGYAGAAFRSQIRTLGGAFSTFKDLLSQASAGSTLGVFNRITKMFQELDRALLRQNAGGGPLTMMQVVEAIDKIVSPNTHMAINLFKFFTGALQGFVTALRLAIWLTNKFFAVVLFIPRKLGLGGGGPNMGVQILGWAAGFLLFAVAARRAAVAIGALGKAFRLEAAAELGSLLFGGGKKSRIGLLKKLSDWAFATTVLKNPKTIGGVFYTKGTTLYNNNGVFAKGVRGLVAGFKALRAAIVSVASAIVFAGRSLMAFLIANPIILGIALITTGLVILYFKWKPFHDLVNKTFKFIIDKAPFVAAALVIAFGPLGAIVAGLLLIIKYHRQIADFAAHPGRHTKNYTGDYKKGDSRLQAFTKTASFGLDLGGMGLPSWLPGRGGILSWFDNGGTVPGRIGSPQIIVAHGGEKVTPVAGASSPNADNARPTMINVVIGRKTILRALAHGDADFVARA